MHDDGMVGVGKVNEERKRSKVMIDESHYSHCPSSLLFSSAKQRSVRIQKQTQRLLGVLLLAGSEFTEVELVG